MEPPEEVNDDERLPTPPPLKEGEALESTSNKPSVPSPKSLPAIDTINIPTHPSPPSAFTPTPTAVPLQSETQLHHPSPTKHHSRSPSLHSSRPAPASPAPSRPGSAILSPNLGPRPSSRDRSGSTSSSQGGSLRGGGRRGSTRPRSQLGSISHVPDLDSGRITPLGSDLGDSLAVIPIPENAALSTTQSRDNTPGPSSRHSSSSNLLIIRDFAYSPTDDRHRGRYPVASPSITPHDTPDSGSTSPKKGWAGFGLLGWKSMLSSNARQSTVSTSDSNFPETDPDHQQDDYEAFSDDDEDDDDDDEPWGLYRAAYAFEPEGAHEIGLQEGDLVDVKGRGGGEGWVVASKRGVQGEGLVPEGYLEKVDSIDNIDDEDSERIQAIAASEHRGELVTTPGSLSSEA